MTILKHPLQQPKQNKNRPKSNCKMQRFSTSVYLLGHNVFWNFQSLLIFPTIVATTIIDSKKSLHRPICILTIFCQFHFVYLYEIYHVLLYNLTTFSTPQKPRKTAFLQPNPVCDFDPWFYDFGKTVMITGAGLKKSYIFRFCVFFTLFWCNDFDVSYTVFGRFFLVTRFFAYFPVATFSSFPFSL